MLFFYRHENSFLSTGTTTERPKNNFFYTKILRFSNLMDYLAIENLRSPSVSVSFLHNYQKFIIVSFSVFPRIIRNFHFNPYEYYKLRIYRKCPTFPIILMRILNILSIPSPSEIFSIKIFFSFYFPNEILYIW